MGTQAPLTPCSTSGSPQAEFTSRVKAAPRGTAGRGVGDRHQRLALRPALSEASALGEPSAGGGGNAAEGREPGLRPRGPALLAGAAAGPSGLVPATVPATSLLSPDDGAIRVWKNFADLEKNPEMVTAWQGLSDMLPTTRGVSSWANGGPGLPGRVRGRVLRAPHAPSNGSKPGAVSPLASPGHHEGAGPQEAGRARWPSPRPARTCPRQDLGSRTPAPAPRLTPGVGGRTVPLVLAAQACGALAGLSWGAARRPPTCFLRQSGVRRAPQCGSQAGEPRQPRRRLLWSWLPDTHSRVPVPFHVVAPVSCLSRGFLLSCPSTHPGETQW